MEEEDAHLLEKEENARLKTREARRIAQKVVSKIKVEQGQRLLLDGQKDLKKKFDEASEFLLEKEMELLRAQEHIERLQGEKKKIA